MNTTPVPAGLGRWYGWTIGLAVLIALTWHATWLAGPEPPLPLPVRITFPTGFSGRIEPLVCTGRYGAGDFLVINYLTENTATLSYDSWGRGGPTSEVFTFVPNVAQPMVIDMPSLRLPKAGVAPERLQPIRVTLGGRAIFQGTVLFHPRRPNQLYFAENPIGGNTAWSVFRGRLTTDDDRRLLGSHRSLFPWRERFDAWWRSRPGAALGVILAGIFAGLIARPAGRWLMALRPAARPARVFAGRRRPAHGWFAVTALVSVLGFSALVTGGTFQFVFTDSFGEFYDYQAASLLHGRLDVPEEALSGEAFVVDGKTYGYYGVTPAVLRLPFAATGVAFGKLSRIYLTLYFAACLVAAYLLLCHAIRLVAGAADASPFAKPILLASRTRRSRERLATGASKIPASSPRPLRNPDGSDGTVLSREGPPGGMGSSDMTAGPRTASNVWPSAAATVLFTLATGLGSTLLFLGARAYVYHEAILCGAAFALWSVYASLRWLEVPGSRWWLGALLTGLFAIQARPTTGLFALCTLGAVALARVAAAARGSPSLAAARPPALVGLLALLAILSFNGMSYLKFRTFDGSPFRYNVQYTPDRMAKFEGRNFHLSNLRHNVDVYLTRAVLEVKPRFPYFFIGDVETDNYPGARVDLEEPTLSLPFAMPALFALAIAGGAWALYWAPRLRVPMGVVAAGVVPMALALFTAVVTSHRYTGDFCPVLVVWAACGLAVVDADQRGLRRWLLGVTAALTLASIGINAAIALYFQGEVVWGVPDDAKRNYTEMRKRVDEFFGSEGVRE